VSDLFEAGQANWSAIARDGWRLGVDAAWVVRLRLVRLAGGGEPARREMALMAAEKYHGHTAYVEAVASGKLGRSARSIAAGTLAFYGLWISDNRRRLAEGD